MFTVYYSQRLSSLAAMFVRLQQAAPNPNPFEAETVIVQSVGMAQWLQMQIAQAMGVAGNYEFPFPTSFLWQQYRLLFPELPKENVFERASVTWRLMRLIPAYLEQDEFAPLKTYLTQDTRQYQLRLYQLSAKIADLFDQYLVYRPNWLVHWEKNEVEAVLNEIKTAATFKLKDDEDIRLNLLWQAKLWCGLIDDIKSESDENIFITSHRAYLQTQYFQKLAHLTPEEKAKLPKRLFIFGISSLPATQFAVFKKLSEHCDLHLFFLNPSQEYWGDSVEDKALEKLALKQRLSTAELDALFAQQGNQLLSMWGKQGREFLAQIVEQAPDHSFEVFDPYDGGSNLVKLKNAMLSLQNPHTFTLASQDKSLQFHACHSMMREVEVLHNRLLHMLEENPSLSPKDIIVMAADIDQYAPYIHAVFSRFDKSDNRYIPFTFSDQKVTHIDPLVASFLSLLNLKESHFNAEALLDLFDVAAIRSRFGLTQEDIYTLRHWVKAVGIRTGLETDQSHWQNYNSWENGLTRLLLGSSLKEENGVWQNSIGFNESYGLSAALAGFLARFLAQLKDWHTFIQTDHPLAAWRQRLTRLIADFYQESIESVDSLTMLGQAMNSMAEKIAQAKFDADISLEIIALLLNEHLNAQQNSLNFLAGKVNFCTLLPMRAIPFKVVCLLGMNEADFPRQHAVNSFNLMQYAPKRGDRARRDDDRYLFLEALLSAQEVFYVSYIGQSPTSNKQKLPSVLVSQLLDYLADHLSPAARESVTEQGGMSADRFLAEMIVRHPLTVFSPKNFSADYVSYDKEWLQLFKVNQQEQTFLNDSFTPHAEIPTDVDLHELIAFICNPTKYFFNHHLGIYFHQPEDIIEETEKFSLNGLDKYQLDTKFIEANTEDVPAFFYQEQLKGKLPIAHFAELTQTALASSIKPLQEVLLPYLSGGEIIEIEQYFIFGQTKIRLFGNIQNRFNDEIIFWKVSSLKDKDLIRLWICTLLLKLQAPDIKVKFIARRDDQVEIFQFNEISQVQAHEQLTVYLTDYLTGFKQLKWGISARLADYFGNLSETENIETYCCQKLLELAEDDYFEQVYLNRILRQSAQLDYTAIHETTMKWFALMQASKLTKKGNKKEK